MTYNLTDINLEEISLVDVPANGEAKVVLFKRDSGDAPGKAGTSGKPSSEKEGHMTVNELEKKLETLEGQVSELTKAKEKAEAEAKKAKEDADAAIAKQSEAVAKAASEAGFEVKIDGDKVAVTKKAEEEYIDIDGEKVLKSSVPAPLLKRLEEDSKRIERLEKAGEKEALRKRANSELPNLSGSDDAKGALLKAIDGIEDEAVRKEVAECLKAADNVVSKAFDELGSSNPADDENSATSKLNKMASDYAKDNKMSFEQAYAEVTKKGEGRELLRKAKTEGAAN